MNGDRVSRQRTLASYVCLFNLLDIQRRYRTPIPGVLILTRGVSKNPVEQAEDGNGQQNN